MSALITLIDALVERLGKLLALLLPVIVILTFGIVIARYAFDVGAIAVQEAVMYLHGTAFMLGFAYALKHDAHVRVDVLANRFSPRTRTWLDLAGHLLFLLPMCVCVIWFCWDYVAAAWRVREGSAEVGGIPGVYLLKSLLLASSGVLLLQGAAEVARCIGRLRQPAHT